MATSRDELPPILRTPGLRWAGPARKDVGLCPPLTPLSSVSVPLSSPRTGDKPVAQIARELRISESCLRNWMAQADTNGVCAENCVRPGQGSLRPPKQILDLAKGASRPRKPQPSRDARDLQHERTARSRSPSASSDVVPPGDAFPDLFEATSGCAAYARRPATSTQTVHKGHGEHRSPAGGPTCPLLTQPA